MKALAFLVLLLLMVPLAASYTEREIMRPGDPNAWQYASINNDSQFVFWNYYADPSESFLVYTDEDIIIATPNATKIPVYTHTDSWNGDNRCDINGGIIGYLPIVPGFNQTGSTGDNLATAILFQGVSTIQYFNTQPFVKCSNNSGIAFSEFTVSNSTFTGNLTFGDHGGSQIGPWQALKPGELKPNGRINHTFLINVYARYNLNYSSASAANEAAGCRSWRASTCDTGFTSSYRGTNNRSKMGMLVSFANESTYLTVNASLKTACGRVLAEALYLFGAVPVDDSAWGPVGLVFAKGVYSNETNTSTYFDAETQAIADCGALSGTQTSLFANDTRAMFQNLSIVVSSSPTQPGGGTGQTRFNSFTASSPVVDPTRPTFNWSITPASDSYLGLNRNWFAVGINTSSIDLANVVNVTFEFNNTNWTIDSPSHILTMHCDDGNDTSRYQRSTGTNFSWGIPGVFGGGCLVNNSNNQGTSGIDLTAGIKNPTSQNAENFFIRMAAKPPTLIGTTSFSIFTIVTSGTFSPACSFLPYNKTATCSWSTVRSYTPSFPNTTMGSYNWIDIGHNNTGAHTAYIALNGTTNATQGVVVPNAPATNPWSGTIIIGQNSNMSVDEVHIWNVSLLPAQRVPITWQYDRLWVNLTQLGVSSGAYNAAFHITYTNGSKITTDTLTLNFGDEPYIPRNLTVEVLARWSNGSVANTIVVLDNLTDRRILNTTSAGTVSTMIAYGLYNLTFWGNGSTYRYSNQTVQLNFTASNTSYTFSVFGAFVVVNASTLVTKQKISDFNASVFNNKEGGQFGLYFAGQSNYTLWMRKDVDPLINTSKDGYFGVANQFGYFTLPLSGTSFINTSYQMNFSNNNVSFTLIDSITGNPVTHYNLSVNSSEFLFQLGTSTALGNTSLLLEQGVNFTAFINASGYAPVSFDFKGNASYQQYVLLMVNVSNTVLSNLDVRNATPKHSFNLTGNATVNGARPNIVLNNSACVNIAYTNGTNHVYFVFNCTLSSVPYTPEVRPTVDVLVNASLSNGNFSIEVVSNEAPNSPVNPPGLFNSGTQTTQSWILLRFNSSDADNDTTLFTPLAGSNASSLVGVANTTSSVYNYSFPSNGTWYFQVRALDGFDYNVSAFSGLYNITYFAGVPTIPDIFLPPNNSYFNTNASIMFRINSSHPNNQTTTLSLFAGTTPTSAGMTLIWNGTGSVFVWEGQANGTYYFRAHASDSMFTSQNTSTYQFTIETGQNVSLGLAVQDDLFNEVRYGLDVNISNSSFLTTVTSLSSGFVNLSLAKGTYNLTQTQEVYAVKQQYTQTLTANTNVTFGAYAATVNFTAVKNISRTNTNFNISIGLDNYNGLGKKWKQFNVSNNITLRFATSTIIVNISVPKGNLLRSTLAGQNNVSYSFIYSFSDNNLTIHVRDALTNNTLTIVNASITAPGYSFSAQKNSSVGNVSFELEQGLTYDLTVGSPGYPSKIISIVGNASQQQYTAYLIGSNSSIAIVNIYDETTGKYLSEIGVSDASIQFISPNQATNISLGNTTTITNLFPGGYEVRYSAVGYNARTYYFESLNQTTTTLNLYLLNASVSSFIPIAVTDTATISVRNATVKALRYYASDNAYKVVAMTRTDENGISNFDLVPNTIWYEFIIDYAGATRLVSVPAKVTGSQLAFVLSLQDNPLKGYYLLDDIPTILQFDNVSSQFIFTWNDLNNAANYGRLTVVQESVQYGPVTICDYIVNSSSGTVACAVPNVTAKYLATGFVHTNTTSSEYLKNVLEFDKLPDLIPKDVYGRLGLFLTIMFVAFIMFLGRGNPEISGGLAIAGVIVMGILGVIDITIGATTTLIIFFIIIIMRGQQ